MRAFVTGGTGFVGGHLVPRLLERGHEVTCLVRDEERAAPLAEKGASLLLGELTAATVLRDELAEHDWLIHLANLYSLWEPDSEQYRRVNVDATRRLFEDALEAAVRKVIHVSSAVTYGTPQDCPFTEDSTPSGHLPSAYARSKASGDAVAYELYHARGLPVVMIYPGAIIGPGDTKPTGKLIANLLKGKMPAMVCGDSVVTFVDVRDVAEAIVLAAERPDNVGEKYLIGLHHLRLEAAYRQICDLAAVAPPRLTLPDGIANALAGCLTALSTVSKRPPAWGLSKDQFATMRTGFSFEGRKAERDLGLAYTPLEQTLSDVIASLQPTD